LREAADAMRRTGQPVMVCKVARTLAGLVGEAKVTHIHLAEALSYRTRSDQVAQAA
jgi:magnesium chelatase family protein